MAGNGPLPTAPVYCSDELIWRFARGDYHTLASPSECLAKGNDGAFAPDQRWTMTSASTNFQSQGVAPQQVIQFTAPKQQFSGTGVFYAIDTVQDNQITLRVPMQSVGVGNPPAPAAGLTNVAFTVNTFYSLIESASLFLKSKFGIDEFWVFRSSQWVYQGAESLYRDLELACVTRVLAMAYTAETRTERGDWPLKIARYSKMAQDALEQVQIKWGPTGTSAEPTSPFSCKITR